MFRWYRHVSIFFQNIFSLLPTVSTLNADRKLDHSINILHDYNPGALNFPPDLVKESLWVIVILTFLIVFQYNKLRNRERTLGFI